MSADQLVQIVALVGFLVLAISGLRARQIGARKVVVMALAWGSIFMAAALLAGFLAG